MGNRAWQADPVTESMDFRTQVLLSLQRALWDEVTPDLLVVAVGWADGVIHARFVYEGPVTLELEEIVREVETYVVADFPEGTSTDFEIKGQAESSTREFNVGEEWWAYRRRGA